MSATIFLEEEKKDRKNDLGQKYTQKYKGYSLPSPLKNNYKFDITKSIETNELLLKNIKEIAEQIVTPISKVGIDLEVELFLQNNTHYDLDFSISNHDNSDYYTVKLNSEDLTFEELFDLALKLNRKAVREERYFSVIAGV